MIKTLLPIACFSSGAVLCAVLTWCVRRWSLRHNFVDLPGGHKGHALPVALGGGVAIALATVLPIATAVLAAKAIGAGRTSGLPGEIRMHLGGVMTKGPMALAIVASACAMCALGLYDDYKPLKPRVKLLGQVLVALFLVIGFDLRLLSSIGWLPSAVLSVLWIVTLCNSMNFLDNMDGLAAGVAMIAACVFASTAMQAGQIFVPACCLLLAGALCGFLPFNIYPASIYMGDAGSLVIGLLLAVFTILTTFADPAQGQAPVGVFAPLVVMAVPLYDTASVIWVRWRAGDPIWAGDRRHFSHRLIRKGMSPPKAVMVIWLATLVTALPALMLPHADWKTAWGVVLQTLLVVALVSLLESSGPHDSATE